MQTRRAHVEDVGCADNLAPVALVFRTCILFSYLFLYLGVCISVSVVEVVVLCHPGWRAPLACFPVTFAAQLHTQLLCRPNYSADPACSQTAVGFWIGLWQKVGTGGVKLGHPDRQMHGRHPFHMSMNDFASDKGWPDCLDIMHSYVMARHRQRLHLNSLHQHGASLADSQRCISPGALDVARAHWRNSRRCGFRR